MLLKSKNPETGKKFKRGDVYPYKEGDKIFGDTKKIGKLFKQYQSGKCMKKGSEYQYMHFVEEDKLTRDRKKNRLGMSRAKQNYTFEECVLESAKKTNYRQYKKSKGKKSNPVYTIGVIYDALLDEWSKAEKIEGNSSDFVRKCPVLGIPMVLKNDIDQRDNSATVHRIDNDRGYSPDNVKFVSYKANRLMSNATVSEIELLAKNMKRLIDDLPKVG
ncbi:MAG: hypothetical protein ACQEW0_02260 [Pseudomonadota bacterium]